MSAGPPASDQPPESGLQPKPTRKLPLGHEWRLCPDCGGTGELHKAESWQFPVCGRCYGGGWEAYSDVGGPRLRRTPSRRRDNPPQGGIHNDRTYDKGHRVHHLTNCNCVRCSRAKRTTSDFDHESKWMASQDAEWRESKGQIRHNTGCRCPQCQRYPRHEPAAHHPSDCRCEPCVKRRMARPNPAGLVRRSTWATVVEHGGGYVTILLLMFGAFLLIPVGVWAWSVISESTDAKARKTNLLGHKYVNGRLLVPAVIEEWIIVFTNEERVRAGLQPLVHDGAISRIARGHSRFMASTGLLEHELEGRDPTDRAMAAGYNCRVYNDDGSYSYGLSENIAKHPRVAQWTGTAFPGSSFRPTIYAEDDQAMARGLVDGWMDSPGHRRNILDEELHRIGVGVSVVETEERGYVSETVYATQNFSGCSTR